MKFTLSKKLYIYIALTIISLSLAATSHVFAQGIESEAPSSVASERSAAADRAALPERVQDRIINLSRNMEARMQAVTARFDNIIARMERRIEKLEAEGVDTSEATVFVGHAKTSLETAKSNLTDLDQTVVRAVTSDSPRDRYRTVRNSLMNTKHAVKDTHTHLRTTLALLKEAAREAGTGNGVSDAVKTESDTSPVESE